MVNIYTYIHVYIWLVVSSVRCFQMFLITKVFLPFSLAMTNRVMKEAPGCRATDPR